MLHSKFEKIVKDEIQVKALASNCSLWVINQHPEGTACLNDSTDKVKGISIK